MAASYPFVPMFIWFVFQDDQGQPWESGVYTRSGAPKGTSPARFAASARPLDARNGVAIVPRGTLTPLLSVHTRRYCATNNKGASIGMTWRVFRGGKLTNVGQQTAPLRGDCTIAARISVKGGVAQGSDVHRDVRDERRERRRAQPPHHDSRLVAQILSRPRRAPASPPTTEGRRATCRRS